MIKPWPLVNSRPVGDYHIFTLREDKRRSPVSGREHPFYVLDSPDWVNVVAVTPQQEVVLIRQFRHGTGDIMLEIPGGMVDEGEDPAVAVARELEEETGYIAEELIRLGSVTPNPAFLTNTCHTFLARNARPVGTQRLDGTEDIEVVLVPQGALADLVSTGEITHALVVAAFYHYANYLNNRPVAAEE